MKITDRYASAVHSSNLRSKPDTTFSDSDVLGAAGLAGKRSPLAIALTRLLSGDNHASREIVEILAASAVGKAWHGSRVELPGLEAEDMGRAVLAWFRDGSCKPCGGHGYRLIDGAPMLSEHACPKCKGTGKVLFDAQWAEDRVGLARWLVAEVEREVAIAGSATMAALAPRLDL